MSNKVNYTFSIKLDSENDQNDKDEHFVIDTDTGKGVRANVAYYSDSTRFGS